MIAPGEIAFTRMFEPPSSRAKVRVKPTIPAFAVTYTGSPVEGIIHAIELMLTIEPPPARAIPGATAWAAKK